jgi:F-type H+-transporting ATPase subunit b
VPQFDTRYFVSQIFWAIVCFGFMWAFIHFWVQPRLKRVQNQRMEQFALLQKRVELCEEKARHIAQDKKSILEDAKKNIQEQTTAAQKEHDDTMHRLMEKMHKDHHDQLRALQAHMEQEMDKARADVSAQIPELARSMVASNSAGDKETVS